MIIVWKEEVTFNLFKRKHTVIQYIIFLNNRFWIIIPSLKYSKSITLSTYVIIRFVFLFWVDLFSVEGLQLPVFFAVRC